MHRLSRSPTDPGFVQNPYPFYDEARAAGDLFFWEEYGMPMAVSHRAVSAILKDRRLGREPITPPEVPPHLVPFYRIEDNSMLELEPPRHTRLRALVLRAFTSRRIARLAPEIEELATTLAKAIHQESADLLPAFAEKLPVIVIARLLGVPEAMADQLLAWSHAMVGMYQARRTHEMELAAAGAAQAFSDFLRGYIDERRARPADDLITHMIAAEEDGERLSTDELITTCILLLNAGHEATVHTIGNGVKAILENDAQSATRPSAIDATVEEVLRYDPPLHLFTRHVYEDIELFGHSFRRGDQLGCLLGAAGRDPALAPDPSRFDPTRKPVPHLAFGAGLHFCVGAPLARLELQIGLRTLFERCPGLALAEPPEYADLYHFHGLSRLIVTRGPVLSA
ncbi:cytochrome P450 [Ovoidimarina sediminis]|uniref:cytochrome P450 n=1 Tax=Ovoidimarina sediminis TaxID=3079856 RepID=UPI0029114CFB|nr:cytochrome P450 [Rhodophyticola sp. MJ-SS7]MDU8942244.1 cytochrome P450 [Rhodophyticola sp. MJ-SS7]